MITLALAGLVGTSAADPAADRAAARVTVDAWLAAQNGGGYLAYAALYDPGFEGVKRVGNTTRTMKRAAWLADRKGMFRQPMVVTAREVVVQVDGDRAEVTLVQGWTQGDFADEGRKRMVLVRTPVGWRIAREEMLTSRVVLTPGACRKALAVGAIRDGEVIALDRDRFGCALVTEPDPDGDGELIVAALRFDRGWKRLAEDRTGYQRVVPTDDGGEGEDGGLAIEAVAIAPGEQALLVHASTVRTGPMFEDVTTGSRLLRVRPAGFVEVLAFTSTRSDGEAYRRAVHTLEVSDRRTRGFFELVVAREEASGDYHGGEASEATSTTRYRWNGTAYVP